MLRADVVQVWISSQEWIIATLQRDDLIREPEIEERDSSLCRQSCHHESSSTH